MWFKKTLFSVFYDNPKYSLYFSLMIISLIPILIISEYNNWGGDFALYLNQAIGLIDSDLTGIYHRQLLLSKYQKLGPYLYPMGTSVLISPVLFFFGLKLYYIKLYGLVYWFGSLVFMYKYLRHLFPDNKNVYKVVIFIGFSYPFVAILNTVLADIYFFFFFNLIIYLFLLIEKRASFVRLLLFGTLLFILFSIKTVGIIVVALFTLYSFKQTIKHRKLIYNFPLVIFGLFYFFYNYLFPFDFSSNQTNFVLDNLSINSILKNFHYYSYIFAEYVSGGLFYIIDHNKTLNTITYLILFLFSAIITINYKQMLLTIKKGRVMFFILIVFVSFFIMLPMTNGPRYLFPVFPILFFFIFNIIPKKFVNFLIFIQIFSLFSYAFIEKSKRLDVVNHDYSNSIEMVRAYNFIDKTIPGDTVVFIKPRVLNLFSDAVGVPETDNTINDFNYIIINYNISKVDPKLLKDWNEIYRSDNVAVLKK